MSPKKWNEKAFSTKGNVKIEFSCCRTGMTDWRDNKLDTDLGCIGSHANNPTQGSVA